MKILPKQNGGRNNLQTGQEKAKKRGSAGRPHFFGVVPPAIPFSLFFQRAGHTVSG